MGFPANKFAGIGISSPNSTLLNPKMDPSVAPNGENWPNHHWNLVETTQKPTAIIGILPKIPFSLANQLVGDLPDHRLAKKHPTCSDILPNTRTPPEIHWENQNLPRKTKIGHPPPENQQKLTSIFYVCDNLLDFTLTTVQTVQNWPPLLDSHRKSHQNQ